MRFFLLMLIYGVVALTLDTTLFANLPWGTVRLDLIIVAVAALSFYQDWRRAVPVIVLYGALVDVASSAPFGLSILSYLVIFFVIRAIIAKISFQRGPALLFWLAVVSLLDKTLCSLILIAATGEVSLAQAIIKNAPFQAAVDALVGFVMLPVLRIYWNLSWEKLTRPKGLVMEFRKGHFGLGPDD